MEDYRRRMAQAALILDGKSNELIGDLKSQMEQAAAMGRYLKVLEIRAQKEAIDVYEGMS